MPATEAHLETSSHPTMHGIVQQLARAKSRYACTTMRRALNLGLTEEELIFRMEHSQAILDFAEVEDTLGRVLLTSSQTTDDGIAVKTAFFGIQTFRGKLEFADRYMRVRYKSPAAVQRWESTRSYCETAGTGRNSLAHWPMTIFPDSKPGTRVVLVSPLQNPRRMPAEYVARFVRQTHVSGQAPSESIGIRRISEIRATVRFATVELFRFEASVNGLPDPLGDLSHWKAATLATIIGRYRKTVTVTESGD